MKKIGIKVMALLCTLSILAFTGCGESEKNNSKMEVKGVTLAGTQDVGLYSGYAGSVTYFITVTGNNIVPFDLTGGNVIIGELNDGAVKIVDGISISKGTVSAFDEEAEFTVSVTGEVPAKEYELYVSVYGVISSNKVTLTVEEPKTITEQLDDLAGKAPGEYTVFVYEDELITPKTLDHSGFTITMKGMLSNSGSALTLGENGAIFTIRSGTTLILENITLEGKSSNDSALIINYGDLVMNEGAVICNNTRTSGYLGGAGVYNLGRASLNGGQIINNNADGVGEGGGVYNAGSSAVFTMNSGKISGNRAGGLESSNAIGGGVKIENGAKFNMKGGEISGNAAVTHGGGVYLWGNNSEFRMEGGSISGNSITTASSTSQGGGVYLGTGSIFKMYGGSISGNKILSTYNALGGGVYIFHAYSEFEMHGGNISGNSTLTNGGGVYLSAGSFKMFNGTISDNEVTGTSVLDGGGGFYNNNGEFTMSGGVISGNKAYRGAGVYDLRDFRISGGIVYGDNGGILRNILINGGTEGSAISGAAYVRPLNPSTHASLGPTVETVRNSSITLEVVNAERVNGGEAAGLTITGLIGSTASLKVLYGGKYLELGSGAVTGGSVTFNFTETPLAAGSWLMILDTDVSYTFEGVLAKGDNIISFSSIIAQ